MTMNDQQAAGEEVATQGQENNAAPEQEQKTQNSATEWHETIDDADLRKYVQGKGFKSAGDAARALQEMEARVAVPQDAKEYELPVPQGDDGKFASVAASWMKEAGIPVQAARSLTAQWNTFQAEQAKAAQVAQEQAGEQAIKELRGDWGQQYEQNLEVGRRAMRAFGVPVEVVDKLSGEIGDAQVIRVFQMIGKSLGEATLNPNGSSEKNHSTSSMKSVAEELYS